MVEGTEMQYVFLGWNLGDLNPWVDIKNERERSVSNNSVLQPNQLGG